MPSTITTYYTFQAATKARSSQVNTNFSNYRGDLLPINENTVSASNHTHYLGGSDHYWLGIFTDEVDLRTSTTTAALIFSGDTSNTTGAYKWQIGGSTVLYAGISGLTNASIEKTARALTMVEYSAGSYTLTITTGYPQQMWTGAGGGGAGGSGGGSSGGAKGGGGGAGGTASLPILFHQTLNLNDVLSITVGAGGAIGNNTTGTGKTGSNGGTTSVWTNGSLTVSFQPGSGGLGGIGASTAVAAGGVGAVSLWAPLLHLVGAGTGGSGGSSTLVASSGSAGSPTLYGAGGAGGAGGPNAVDGYGGGGGGGAASYGIGGAGGNGGNGASGTAGSTGGLAAGGGGGGGGSNSGAAVQGGVGGAGGGGVLRIFYVKN